MSVIETFGADREDIQSMKFKKYRGKNGQTDRVGIVATNEQHIFKGAKIHFKDRFFLCKSTKQKKEICCLHSYEGNRPKYRIGCILVVYDLVSEGGKMKLKGYELLPWIFGEKMYQKLVEINKEYPLLSHDLKLTCTNEDYQEINALNCKESLWNTNTAMKERILKEAESMYEDVARSLAADLGITEIREQLGIEAPGSQDAAADVDMETVVDGI